MRRGEKMAENSNLIPVEIQAAVVAMLEEIHEVGPLPLNVEGMARIEKRMQDGLTEEERWKRMMAKKKNRPGFPGMIHDYT